MPTRKPVQPARVAMAASAEVPPAKMSFPRLRAVLAPGCAIAGIDLWGPMSQIGPSTRLPGRIWTLYVEWQTRRRLTGYCPRYVLPYRTFPRGRRSRVTRGDSWTAQETETLAQWVRHRRVERMGRLERAGMLHLLDGSDPDRENPPSVTSTGSEA